MLCSYHNDISLSSQAVNTIREGRVAYSEGFVEQHWLRIRAANYRIGRRPLACYYANLRGSGGILPALVLVLAGGEKGGGQHLGSG